MKVRGERECRECGRRWSYYETGSVECPDCESFRSVGVDDRTAHTDAPVSLDLSAHRARFGEATGTLPAEGVDELKSDLRAYVRKRGFIRGGELLPLDTTYLAARELLEAVDCYDRLRDPTDPDREYLLDLLSGADEGTRLPTEAVPDRLREARGMAAARAVDEYRSDLLAFLDELAGASGVGSEDETPTVSVSAGDGDDVEARIEPARAVLNRLRDRVKRVEALNGDIPAADADALVDAANALGEWVRTGDDVALERARERLTQQDA
ncbi:DUF7117 family protein [Halorubrum sp. HHNYT27]|uniref:DUF7117 family protein n=1 Tax=Halorubrum sp. HHNYT27 TaxID=3402275 RepID=UPI003EBC88A9